jgi:hypothetical protein
MARKKPLSDQAPDNLFQVIPGDPGAHADSTTKPAKRAPGRGFACGAG